MRRAETPLDRLAGWAVIMIIPLLAIDIRESRTESEWLMAEVGKES
jgi:hypothetical protein